MHELSIALSIIDVAEEEAQRRGGANVLAVHLKLGPLSGVVKEALLSAWDLACEQTALEGARLIVEEVPVLVHCVVCNAQRPVESIQEMRCRTCGTLSPDIVFGRELEVTALEISE